MGHLLITHWNLKKDIYLGGVLAVLNTNFWTQSCKSSGQYSANTFNSTQFSYNKKKRWWRQFAKLYHTLKTCCLGGCSFEDASEQTLPHPNIKILQWDKHLKTIMVWLSMGVVVVVGGVGGCVPDMRRVKMESSSCRRKRERWTTCGCRHTKPPHSIAGPLLFNPTDLSVP